MVQIKMTYKIKRPKVKEKQDDLFKAPNIDEDKKKLEGDSFKEEKAEGLGDWGEKETDTFKIAPEEKEIEPKDTYEVEPEEKETEAETDTFEVDNKDAIAEIQQDIESEDMPIEIKSATTLIVKAGGEAHTITRKDLIAYQRQAGSQSGYRQLGSIGGDWRQIETIAGDVTFVFNKIDSKLGAYRTSTGEDD
jgi:hypothetical protein